MNSTVKSNSASKVTQRTCLGDKCGCRKSHNKSRLSVLTTTFLPNNKCHHAFNAWINARAPCSCTE